MTYLLIKSIFDRGVAFIGLIVLSPIFAMVVAALALVQNGSVFFVQQRVGLNENLFNIVKFKTMTDKRDAMGNLLTDHERLTRIGKFIRQSSLDEIPQLINVLLGDMSIVGPRPLLVEYIPLYSPEQKRRHEVKPGITGWAQVNGRNLISWEKKFELDVWYVDNVSFSLDIKILWKTGLKILKREGISSENHATVEKFKGS